MRTLDEAIKKAEAAGTGAYIDIEVVTEKYAASPLTLTGMDPGVLTGMDPPQGGLSRAV